MPQTKRAGRARTAPDTHPPRIHPLCSLPFVDPSGGDDRKAGGLPAGFWHVAPTGRYWTDCNLGRALGAEAVAAIRAGHSHGHLLSDTARAQIPAGGPEGEGSGLIIGFWTAVDRALSARTGEA